MIKTANIIHITEVSQKETSEAGEDYVKTILHEAKVEYGLVLGDSICDMVIDRPNLNYVWKNIFL